MSFKIHQRDSILRQIPFNKLWQSILQTMIFSVNSNNLSLFLPINKKFQMIFQFCLTVIFPQIFKWLMKNQCNLIIIHFMDLFMILHMASQTPTLIKLFSLNLLKSSKMKLNQTSNQCKGLELMNLFPHTFYPILILHHFLMTFLQILHP